MPKKIHSIANKNLLMAKYWEKFYGLLPSGERFGFLSYWFTYRNCDVNFACSIFSRVV